MKKRDASVELLRVVACIIVVLVHARSIPLSDVGDSFGKTLISCFVADGVSVFWLITGFFYLRSNSYARVMKRGFTKIALPAVLLMVICLVLADWINGKATVAQAIENFNISDLTVIIRAWFMGNAAMIPACDHLWYVFMYVLALLWFPLLKRFDTDDKKIRYQKWVLMGVALFYIIVETWCDRFEILEVINADYYRVISASLFLILVGDEIYRNRHKFLNNWIVRIGSLVVFVATNIVRAINQVNAYEDMWTESKVMFWYSLYGIICSVCLALFFLSFNVREGVFSKVVVWVAGFTFPIYLIHYVYAGILYNYPDSFRFKIYDIFGGANESALQYLGFDIVYGIILFAVSLLISIIIVYAWRLIVLLWGKLFRGGKNAS